MGTYRLTKLKFGTQSKVLVIDWNTSGLVIYDFNDCSWRSFSVVASYVWEHGSDVKKNNFE